MPGTIAISNPSLVDKQYTGWIQSVGVPGLYGQVALTSTGGEVGASSTEGGTVGTASGNLVMYRGTAGTITVVGTGNGLPVTLQTLIAGEDLTNNRLNVNNNPSFATNILLANAVGTAAIGTLVAAPGVGTSIYVTSFSIDGDSTVLGTAEVCLSFGTAQTGTAVLFRATLATLNDVAIQSYAYGVNGGITNTPLTYLIVSGAGTVSWNVQYYVH